MGENLSANMWASIRTGQELTLPDTIYKTVENNGAVRYWTYRYDTGVDGGSYVGATYQRVNNEDKIDTKVYYEDEEIDIAHLGSFEIGREVDIPDQLSWGAGVQGEIGYILRRVTYGCELLNDDVREAKALYLNAKQRYQ